MFARNKNEQLIQILEFPVLFLGAKPSDTPSFYSFMNYADFGLVLGILKQELDVVRAMKSFSRRAWSGFFIPNANIEKL
jgi:phytoene desaturase